MTRSAIQYSPDCGSGIPLAALGLIAVGTGIYHGSPLCTALGVVLLCLPLAVYVILRQSVRNLRLGRSAPESAFEGETVDVKISLHNASPLSLFLPRVSEVFTPEIHAQKDLLFPYRVRPGETVEESYQGHCLLPRGIYPLGPMAVSVSDPFGWFQARKTFGGQRTIKIYPKFHSFGVRESLGESISLLLDDKTRSSLGESHEFCSVREYRIGDPLRRVHWGLTAHRGYPVVREYARNLTGDLRIYLDLYRYAFLGVGRGSSLEQSVRITASLSSHALRRGYRVELTAMGTRSIHVPSGSSPSHLPSILDALIEVKPDGTVPLDDLLESAAGDLGAGGTVVIPVSPYLRDSTKFHARLVGLRHTGVRVILVVFDDASYRSLYEIERADSPVDEYTARVRAMGVETFRIACGADLVAAFSERPT